MTMKLNSYSRLQGALVIGLMAAGVSFADTIVVTYEGAGVQTPDTTAICGVADVTCDIGTETFNSYTGSWNGTADFVGTTGITGTYSGQYYLQDANAYGGAGGTGKYIDVDPGESYTLSLSVNGVPGVNYFGLWFSALDAGNLMQFYNGSTLLYSFTPADFINLVGACSGSNLYCGNPNNRSEDSGEQFAFLNFFDTTGFFTSIVFSEGGSYSGDFESDNHTVAYLNPPDPSGTDLYAPEPGGLGLFAAGGIVLALGVSRRRGGPSQIG